MLWISFSSAKKPNFINTYLLEEQTWAKLWWDWSLCLILVQYLWKVWEFVLTQPSHLCVLSVFYLILIPGVLWSQLFKFSYQPVSWAPDWLWPGTESDEWGAFVSRLSGPHETFLKSSQQTGPQLVWDQIKCLLTYWKSRDEQVIQVCKLMCYVTNWMLVHYYLVFLHLCLRFCSWLGATSLPFDTLPRVPMPSHPTTAQTDWGMEFSSSDTSGVLSLPSFNF